MATAFDGLGTGYLGSERSRFKTGEPSLSMALGALGLQQAGIIDDMNEWSNPQNALRKKIIGAFSPSKGVAINDGTKGYQPSQNLWEAPPGTNSNENAGAMVPPAMEAAAPPMPAASGVAPSPAPAKTIDQHVDDVIPRQSSFVSPNTLTPQNSSDDAQILAMASQPVAPPQQMNNQGGQGGGLLSSVAPKILEMLLA
jgi:hypothetical protein